MTMHSLAYSFIFLLLAIVLVGALYAVFRTVMGRIVDRDHTGDPNASRPKDFGAKDRRRAAEVEGHEDPELLP